MSNENIIQGPGHELAENLRVKADGSIELKCGGASISLFSDGSIVLNGTNIKVNGTNVDLIGTINMN